jgi:hypothetical protein
VVVIPALLPILVLLSPMAVAVALPYVGGPTLRGLSFATGAVAVLSATLASFVTLFKPLPELPIKLLQIAFVGSAPQPLATIANTIRSIAGRACPPSRDLPINIPPSK